MCNHGDTVDVSVLVVASHSHTGQDRRTARPIDRCIATAVRELDAAGVRMTGSCCGHGRVLPSITLDDGSYLWREPSGRWWLAVSGTSLSAADPARRAGFSYVDVDPPEPLREALRRARARPVDYDEVDDGRAWEDAADPK